MKNKKPSYAKIRAEKTHIETLDEYRNTIKFLEAKCLRLENELSKLRQHDVIKNEVAVCVHENIEVILPIRRCLKCQHIEEWTPKQTVL